MDLTITSVETIIVDLPLRRLQQFSALDAFTQSYVVIRIRTEDGPEGIGEAVTPGGPWWGGESVEAMKVTIDQYLSPILIGEDAANITQLGLRMKQKVAANPSAKAGLEMALLDLLAKSLNQPLYVLFGGKLRDSLKVAWPLATGDAGRDIEEAEEKLRENRHDRFKIKMGALPVEEDVARAVAIGEAMQGRASVRVDPNQVWDLATARRWIPKLEDAGIDLIEQPIASWNFRGMARLTQSSRAAVMADESMASPQDMLEIISNQAAAVVSLKIMKSGGILASRSLAQMAEAGGVQVYMGTFLESSLGTAGNMHLAVSLPNLPWGGELIGPQLLAEDICETPADYHDNALWLQQGVGLGVALDEAKVRAFRRDRDYSAHQVLHQAVAE